MRATQLLGCQVYDADGDLLGHVHDLRFEASSPSTGHKTGWNCRLTGLACGRRSPVGHRLGYGTGDMAGPWPLSAIFRRRRQRSLEINWSDVANLDRPRIELKRRRRDYEQGSGR
jgi:hypothetical protein